MHRVDTTTAAPALPSQDAPATPGFFTKGNPGTGTNATVPGQDWFNAVQEELVNLVTGMGVVLDRAQHDQVVQAVKRIAGGNVTSLTADATLTVDQAGLVLADRSALAGIMLVTLPPANSLAGLSYRIVQVDTGGVSIIILPDGADTIDGGASVSLHGQHHSVTITSDGAGGWFSDQLNGKLNTPTIDFQRIGQTYFRYDSPASFFSVSSPIPVSSGFFVIGPAVGVGGATFAWPDLAKVPDDVRGLELLLKVNVQTIMEPVGVAANVIVTVKDITGVNQLPIAVVAHPNPNHVVADVAYVRQTVLVSPDRTFRVSWTKAGNSTFQLADVYLQGYWK